MTQTMLGDSEHNTRYTFTTHRARTTLFPLTETNFLELTKSLPYH